MTTFTRVSAEDIAGLAVQACADTWAVVSEREAARRLRAFDCYRIDARGEPVGVVIMRGTDAHIAVVAKARGAWAGRSFYRFLADEVARRGRLTVRLGNRMARRFVETLEERGFVTCEN